MVKKWGITAAPNDKNPGRQKLLIKGEMNDIFLIVKTLRGVCSRPEKISGDFNFAIYLTELAPATVAKLKGVMGELNLVPAEVKPEIAGRNVVESIEPFEAPRQKLELPPDTRPAPAESKPPVQPRPRSRPPLPCRGRGLFNHSAGSILPRWLSRRLRISLPRQALRQRLSRLLRTFLPRRARRQRKNPFTPLRP